MAGLSNSCNEPSGSLKRISYTIADRLYGIVTAHLTVIQEVLDLIPGYIVEMFVQV